MPTEINIKENVKNEKFSKFGTYSSFFFFLQKILLLLFIGGKCETGTNVKSTYWFKKNIIIAKKSYYYTRNID